MKIAQQTRVRIIEQGLKSTGEFESEINAFCMSVEAKEGYTLSIKILQYGEHGDKMRAAIVYRPRFESDYSPRH